MKKLFFYCSITLGFLGIAGVQPAAAQEVLIGVRNVQVRNTPTPQIKFDVYWSATPAYIAAVTSDPANGLQNVDISFDVDFGTDGSTAYSNPNTNGQTYSFAPTLASRTSTIVQGSAGAYPGGNPAGYDNRFKLILARTQGTSTPDLTTTPVLVGTYTVDYPAAANVTIGTVANGAKIQVRTVTPPGQTSKWAAFTGTIDQPVGTSTVNPAPLPLDLLSFTAEKADGHRVQLNWVTANERKVDHFNVERSADGKSFTTVVGTAKAHNPAAGSANLTYQAYDNSPINGTNYYRLNMVDQNGAMTYSTVRTINYADGVGYTLSPNPAAERITITGTSATSVVRILSSNGALLREQVGTEGGFVTVNIAYLATGSYYAQVIEGGQVTYTAKFNHIK